MGALAVKIYAAVGQYGDDNSGEVVVVVLGTDGDQVHHAAFAAHDRGELADPEFVTLTAEQATQVGMRRGAILRRGTWRVLGHASRRGESRLPVPAVEVTGTYAIEVHPGEFVAYERAPSWSGRQDCPVASRSSRAAALDAAAQHLASHGSCFARETANVPRIKVVR